ncbi:hypothetical protein AB7714_01200 [Tardiphaga sp. 1201_B9_N1_1]|uniref:hypothetical protein n=1 Tax=Tardiphaga sp. 1201_B9_N1_1 TaxID=3240377 RepID=UPI003F248C94
MKDHPKRRRILEQPPEVVRRWTRLRVSSSTPRIARAIVRLKLGFSERKRKRALEGAFVTIKNLTIELEHTQLEATPTILNMALYFLLAERDIQCVKIDALTHPDEWTRKLLARFVLLTIYEWDFKQITGLRLKDALDTIQAPEELRASAIASLRKVRAVQRKAHTEFAELRNNTIAHRNADALAQYRAIRNLNVARVFEIVVEFYKGADEFIEVLPQLIAQSRTISSLIGQIEKSRELKV